MQLQRINICYSGTSIYILKPRSHFEKSALLLIAPIRTEIKCRFFNPISGASVAHTAARPPGRR